MNKTFLKCIGAAASVIALTSVSVANGGLTIGSAAPQLKVAKWLKGKAANKFEPGKTYVVEFWATWCGPCKESIPHLNQMANGEFNNKVQFIGVSVWERAKGEKGAAYQAKVKQFVDEMGSKMNYSIAVDGEDDFMATNWLKAANQNGIPSAFIVHDQKVAWIGHPMDGMDGVLREILAGKFDPSAAAKKIEAKQAAAAKESEMNAKVASGDFKGALDMFESIMSNSQAKPEQIAKSRALFYNNVAWEALTGPNSAKANLPWVLDVAEKAMKFSENDPLMMDTCALANFKSGNKARAIELQEAAVHKVKAMPDVDPALVKEMTDRLAEFKKG